MLAVGALARARPGCSLPRMDLPVRDDEWLLDEVGDEYRLDADGEREYRILQPGENPEYDAWLIQELETALWEIKQPGAVLIDHADVERETARICEERLREMARTGRT